MDSRPNRRCLPGREAGFLKKSVTGTGKRPPAGAEGRLKISKSIAAGAESLFVMHFRRGRGRRLDFLELRKRTQARRFCITGAAARGGQQRERGNDKCGNDANHGISYGGFQMRWVGIPGWEMNHCLVFEGHPAGSLISWEPRKPADWGRGPRSGSRKRREGRRRRR